MVQTILGSVVEGCDSMSRSAHGVLSTALRQNRENRPVFLAKALFYALYSKTKVINYNALGRKIQATHPSPCS